MTSRLGTNNVELPELVDAEGVKGCQTDSEGASSSHELAIRVKNLVVEGIWGN